MADEYTAQLEARLRRLEAQQRLSRWGLLVVVAALVAGAGVTKVKATGPTKPSQATVEAREFIIRGDAGQPLFYVGPEKDGVVLLIRDHTGRVTARLPATTEIRPAGH